VAAIINNNLNKQMTSGHVGIAAEAFVEWGESGNVNIINHS